jgi:hypothetical protein
MRFVIHTNGTTKARQFKFTVPAIPAGISGVWSEPDRDILRPDDNAIRVTIPSRYRKAMGRTSGRFWYDGECRWNGERASSIPYLHVYDSRNRILFTLYAIPVA